MKKSYLPREILEEHLKETRKFISILEGELPHIIDGKLKAKKQLYLGELKEELKNLIRKPTVTNNSKKILEVENYGKKRKEKK